MRWNRLFLWLAAVLFAPFACVAVWVAIVGWNGLRGPIERLTEQRTGRALSIQGDLGLHLAWPLPRVHADLVRFANPQWTQEPQMLTVDTVDISVDVQQLLQGHLVFPVVHLVRPVIVLEQDAQGRKNWLLDRNQQNEDARIHIGQLMLDQGTLRYEDPVSKTRIRAELSMADLPAGGANSTAEPDAPGVRFRATGHYQGLPLQAQGSGGPVLALRDEHSPYPLNVDATIGHTRIKAAGTVTGLVTRSAVDMQLAVRGDSMEQLYTLLGIPTPATPAYATQGHLAHSGKSWRYEAFSGRVGHSDIAGSAQIVTGGKRPLLTGQLTSNVLDLDDLAPVIGKRPTQGANVSVPAAAETKTKGVLPDIPFKTDRWASMDADVQLHAKQIRRAKALPLNELTAHLKLQDAVLTLTPINFGVAGGHLNAEVSLDGRNDPIQAKARVQVDKVQLAQLFPTVQLNQASIGQINGSFTLSGRGNAIGSMLAHSNGHVALVIARGEVSRLMMEKAGLHLWEILELNVTGDQRVTLRCALADFDVKNGVMQANALVFDTQVTTLFGSGQIDLAHETLDLSFNQKTKNTSPLALRSPIHIRGSFAKPEAGVDKGRVALRAAGAVALGLINPLLVLIPLVDPGPGQDSDCANLVRTNKGAQR